MNVDILLAKVEILGEVITDLKQKNSRLEAELTETAVRLKDSYDKQLEMNNDSMKMIVYQWYAFYCSKNKIVPDMDMIRIIKDSTFEEASKLADRFNQST